MIQDLIQKRATTSLDAYRYMNPQIGSVKSRINSGISNIKQKRGSLTKRKTHQLNEPMSGNQIVNEPSMFTDFDELQVHRRLQTSPDKGGNYENNLDSQNSIIDHNHIQEQIRQFNNFDNM